MVEIDQQSLNAPKTPLCHVGRHFVQLFSACSINQAHFIFSVSHARFVPKVVNFRLITLANPNTPAPMANIKQDSPPVTRATTHADELVAQSVFNWWGTPQLTEISYYNCIKAYLFPAPRFSPRRSAIRIARAPVQDHSLRLPCRPLQQHCAEHSRHVSPRQADHHVSKRQNTRWRRCCREHQQH